MRLIGMLASPYVRRTAISLACLGVPFTHEAVSVISTFEQFKRINPVVKAPTLVCDDGAVLMDSSLIVQFAEAALSGGRSLWPADAQALQGDMRAVGLALAACEKAVQTIYERKLRPADKQHEPWLVRVQTQLAAALQGLEQEVATRAETFGQAGQPPLLNQASVTAAVSWQFIHETSPEVATAEAHPALAALSERMEATEVFQRFPPVGPGVNPPQT